MTALLEYELSSHFKVYSTDTATSVHHGYMVLHRQFPPDSAFCITAEELIFHFIRPESILPCSLRLSLPFCKLQAAVICLLSSRNDLLLDILPFSPNLWCGALTVVLLAKFLLSANKLCRSVRVVLGNLVTSLTKNPRIPSTLEIVLYSFPDLCPLTILSLSMDSFLDFMSEFVL